MKHQVFIAPDDQLIRLRQATRRTVSRALWIAAGPMIATVSVITGVLANRLLSVGVTQSLMITLFIAASASTLVTFATSYLANRIAAAASRPLETVLGYLASTDEPIPLDLRFFQGKAMDQSDIDADLVVLDRRMRSLARRAKITIADLEKAREQANEQNLAKSKFLANMGHELRTPLNAILGYALLLQEDASDAGNASAASDLERIQHAGRNLLRLINDILDLSRMEAGKTVIEREVIDVPSLAQTIIASNCTVEQRKGNMFDLNITPNIGMIIGDMSKVRQCVGNLLDNAFKFTEKGRVSLTIQRSGADGLPTIEFIVRDTGIGIEEKEIESLFQAFEQSDSGFARRYGGSGLGLAITRRLARMMGGDCVVESIKGQGASFRLILPQSPISTFSQTNTPIAEPVLPLDAPGGRHSVLVIDDDADALDLMDRWLGQMGLRIIAAKDSKVGHDLARLHRPDVILLDALMPGQSGYDLITALRGDEATADIPVVLITIDDDRRRGIAAGASDYIRKPVSKEQLRSVIEVYCGKASGEILIIDDDNDAADLIRRSVEEVGFTTFRATNGVEGMTMAHQMRPSAIVLDLAMPELDGFGVLERLSANAELCNIPLIVLSGQEIGLSEHRELLAAGHRFFTKAASTPREIAQSLKEMVA